VFLGDPQRFVDGKALASYVGLIPREHSSAAHRFQRWCCHETRETVWAFRGAEDRRVASLEGDKQ